MSASTVATATGSVASTRGLAQSAWPSRSCERAAITLTGCFKNRRRAERALVAVIAECYVRGVSTRRVDGLVKTLGIEGISKSQVSRMAKTLDEEVAAFRSRPLDGGAYPYLWVDALSIRVREGGRVVKVCCVVATAVNSEGSREIVGLDTFTEESGPAWTAFLRDLGVVPIEVVDRMRTPSYRL